MTRILSQQFNFELKSAHLIGECSGSTGLSLRSLFERRPDHSTLLDSVVPRQVRKLLSPILIVSGRDDRNVRRRILERSERANHADGGRPLTSARWRAGHEMLGVL